MTPAVAALLALAAGYILGRARLGHRVSDWAHWLMYGRRLTRRDWQWWATQPVFAVEIAYLIAIRPRQTWRAWITRNEPPPPLGPPVRVRRIGREDR
ncbi:hypothetical protein ACFQ9H_19380 [Streptomyces sp. NPDC056517]|uniref:hypothetical protein n=1 Tax=Streptomyces sp. NPDC056517 TaxID=3345848 RepID=UPI0036B45DD9